MTNGQQQPKRLASEPDHESRFDINTILDATSSQPRPRAEFVSIEAERGVLAAAMEDERACSQAVMLLRPEHFEGRHHRQMFEAIERLFSEGQPVNPVTVIDVEPSLPSSYVTDVYTSIASTANVEYHARILIEKWMERRAVALFRRAAGEVGNTDIIELLDKSAQFISELTIGTGGDTHIRHAVQDALKLARDWKTGKKTDLMPTGIYGLDAAIGGFPVGEMTTLAGPTGGGKTSLMGQFVIGCARREARSEKPRSVLVFSCEMTREQLAARFASNTSEVNIRALRAQAASDAEFDKFTDELIKIGQLPVHIDDAPNPTLQHIAARCQHIASTDGLAAVFVDYDEKVDSEGKSEELRVSAIAQGLKAIAKRFRVPVITLSQYSRGVTHDVWPTNEWLRYSGKKEHESAVVLHWHWPRYWTEKGINPDKVKGYDPSRPQMGSIRCTKNRFGPQRYAELIFDERYTRFIDPADPDTPLAKRVKPHPMNHQDNEAPF